jgi:Na+-translocating ferredoxin:NAD+ oxidoreductase RnfC subunit
LRQVGLEPEGVGLVMVGGVMMGKVMGSLEEVVTRTTGALLCFPADHIVARRYRTTPRQMDVIGMSACDQCSFCTEMCPRYLLGHPVEPHVAMRSLQFNRMGEAATLGAQFCCECNLCTLYACPEDLFPSFATIDNKLKMRRENLTHPVTGRTDLPVHSMFEYRRIPVASLIKKLGLAQYRNVGPLIDVDWQVSQVRIPLRQHIGAAARPIVARGDRVRTGQKIAEAPEGLGVAIHASIPGEVLEVTDHITVRA